jgi:uncharacterized membrane protein YfcA
MEPVQMALVLGVLAVFAHIVKGLTGFGPAIVFVSIGSVFYDPVEVIVLASVLDVVGGAYLVSLNPDFLENREYWGPIGLLMVAGAVFGSFVLSVLSVSLFEYLFGAAIVLISFWFLSGRSELDKGSEDTHQLGARDGLVGVFSGFCGGIVGMGGPPLVAYLGDKFDKGLFRAIIVPVFLMAASSRVLTYGYLGMIEIGNLWLYVFPPLGVLIGNRIGNHFFEDVEQKRFTVLIGIILMLSGIRLLIG